MIPCLFRRMALHIDSHTPISRLFFPNLLSPTADPSPTPRITKYFLGEHTINCPRLFPTFSDLILAFSTSQPLAPKPLNLQHLIFNAHQQHPNSPQPPNFFPLKNLIRFLHLLLQPFKNCAPEALCHNLFHESQPTCPQRQPLIHSLISPPQNRQSPPHRKCYPPPQP